LTTAVWFNRQRSEKSNVKNKTINLRSSATVFQENREFSIQRPCPSTRHSARLGVFSEWALRGASWKGATSPRPFVRGSNYAESDLNVERIDKIPLHFPADVRNRVWWPLACTESQWLFLRCRLGSCGSV
jgi:hypothetical protein